MAASSQQGNTPRFELGQKTQDAITGWLYIAPAMILTFLFGLFPIGYAVYMSFYGRRVAENTFQCTDSGTFVLSDCMANYTEIVGDWTGALIFVLGLSILVGAYWLWGGDKGVFKKTITQLTPRQILGRAFLPIILVISSFFFVSVGQQSLVDAETTLAQVETLDTPLEDPRLSRRLSDEALEAWAASSQTEPVYDVLRSCDSSNQSDTLSSEQIIANIVTCLDAAQGNAVRALENQAAQTRFAGYLQIGLAPTAIALAIYVLAFADRLGISKAPREQDGLSIVGRLVPALIIAGLGAMLTAAGYGMMLATSGEEAFIRGLTITLYFALGSVPIQLSLSLVLAYILYQNLRGREFFRMLFFIPYVTPAVAAAVVFNVIFRPSEGLANNIVTFFGGNLQAWLNEPEPVLNIIFGTNFEGFWAGPSLALVCIIVVGIWTYTGYNAVIFLAGLGQIPGDLYEAARVDGANEWHLFRYITLPMISPITFYLSVLAFIGTFKAFNTIYVMRTPSAQETVDTASLVVFETFRARSQYGLATAQAILLFLVIMGLTQVQRTFFEKKVFYG